MNSNRRRRLAAESLESRLLLDATGMEPLPQQATWEQVVVTFRNDVQNPRAAAGQVVRTVNGHLGHVYEHALKGFSARLPAAAVTGLARNPQIASVETDMIMQSFQQDVPTGIDRIDAELNATGGLIGGGKQIDVDIAVIDSGIAAHSDLEIKGGRRFYTVNSGPPNSRARSDDNYADDNGHGTHVAGIAAAKDDSQGVVGVAPGASLWAVKVLGANGTGYMSDIIAGVDWVTERANVIEVANMSLGGVGRSDALHAAIQASVGAGIVYVVAAGNDWADIHGTDKTVGTSDDTIPAAYSEVATISAFADSDGLPGGEGGATSWGQYGKDDAWWGPSNFSNSDGSLNDAHWDANPVDSPGLGIDLSLPGVDIQSTWLNGGYDTHSGTSMAAPHAAGLAALHIAEHGRANNAAEVYAIRQALIDGGQPWNQEMSDPWGPDNHAENIGWAAQEPAVMAPAVSIEAPVGEADVSGSVTVTATAQAFGDGVELSEIGFAVRNISTEIIIDSGVIEAPTDAGPWTWEWNTLDAENGPLYEDGSYIITVQATDTAGNTGSDSVTVLLDNVNDAPQIEMTSPSAGATLSGDVTLAATASDDRGVDQVEFFAGELSLGVAEPQSGGLWTLPWTTSNGAWDDGTYVLHAVATDNNGLSTRSADISVTVNNSVAVMHADLEGSATQINRNFWQANATVTIKNESGGLLQGAVVQGRWIEEGIIVAGTTDSLGQVSFSSDKLRASSIDFTVESVELASYEYTGQDTITIYAPGQTQSQSAAMPALEPEASSLPAIDEARKPTRFADAVDWLMTEDLPQLAVASGKPLSSSSPAPAPSNPAEAESSDDPESADVDASLLSANAEME